MQAFEVLADPVRRQILDLLVEGECNSGAIVTAMQKKHVITQSAVSQHLRVLRDSGFATVRVDGQRRLYSVAPTGLKEIDTWLDKFRTLWTPRLEALSKEIERGKSERKRHDTRSV